MDTASWVIVMTPIRRGPLTTLECVRSSEESVDQKRVAHIATGGNQGIVINKAIIDENGSYTPLADSEAEITYKCFVVNQDSGGMRAETRKLKFWFVSSVQKKVTSWLVQTSFMLFNDLISPGHVPKDYANFIKRVMRLMLLEKYQNISRIHLDVVSLDINQAGIESLEERDDRPLEVRVHDQLMRTIEEAYPNVLTTEELSKVVQQDEKLVVRILDKLLTEGRLHRMAMEGKNKGKFAYVLQLTQDEANADLGMGKVEEIGEGNMDVITKMKEKPTVAIITNLMCEKRAVDAVMQDKTTYVRYETKGGDSHVYTIGFIGPHKCVSTKLPAVGRDRRAKIASGNTTTRLLGTFQDIEHVLLVGVCGSVCNLGDLAQSSRLGDIIVAAPSQRQDSAYVYCDNVTSEEDSGQLSFSLKQWRVPDPTLLRLAANLVSAYGPSFEQAPWTRLSGEVAGQLADFARPEGVEDKVQMQLGDGQVIEIAPPSLEDRLAGQPAVRMGPLGSGKPVVSDTYLRSAFAAEKGLLGYDTEFDQVLESILGNRCNSFLVVRACSDYHDGQKGSVWQPYASLQAAAFAKSVLQELV